MASHYVLTSERHRAVKKMVAEVLGRRVSLMRQSWPFSIDELMRQIWTDDDIATFNKTRAILPEAMMRPSGGHLRVFMPSPHNAWLLVYFHSTQPGSAGLVWPSCAALRCGANGHTFGEATNYDDAAFASVPWLRCPWDYVEHDGTFDRVGENRRIYEWAFDMFRVLKRADYGLKVFSDVLAKSTHMANLEATIPEIKALCGGEPGIAFCMNKAPRRTLSNYRVSVAEEKIQALRHLIAEGLILPPILPHPPPAPVVAQTTCYFDLERAGS